jgi:hypothetical protein
MIAASFCLGPGVVAALAMTGLLTAAADGAPLRLWDFADRCPVKASWRPVAILAVLAIASSLSGIMHPLEFAAAYGQDVPDPVVRVSLSTP